MNLRNENGKKQRISRKCELCEGTHFISEVFALWKRLISAAAAAVTL